MDTKMEAVQESIKLALDAADAATDVTSEYNKVKKAHEKLEAKVKQIHKYTTIVFLSSIISGLVVITVSAFLFMQSSDKLTNMTETSREALVVFAENVDGVNASLKNLDNAIKEQGDLLEINKKLVVTLNKIEKRMQTSNENTVAELQLITNTRLLRFSRPARPIAPVDSGSSISPSPQKTHTFLSGIFVMRLLFSRYFIM